jgi:hypothetical protein
MHDWRMDSAIDIVDSPRYTCFTEVATRAEKILSDNCTAIVATRVSYNIQDMTIDSAPVWHKKLFNMLCRSSFEKLSRILKKQNAKWFLLAVDECSELDRTKTVDPFREQHDLSPLWGMSLTALKHIIKAYDEFVAEVPVWFLFLDTNSSVIDMDAFGQEGPSDRFEKGYISLPAWPYVGFNQMAEKDVFAPAKGKKLPTHVHFMKHLKRCGRPVSSTPLVSQFHLIHWLP